jgi:cysteine desulfurase / selenocysteine lyase
VSNADPGQPAYIREARTLFPATAAWAYFNTAAVGLASHQLSAACHRYIDEWSESGLDYARGEAAAEAARTAVAALIGTDRSNLALIASVSGAAGLVAAQFGPASSGQNVVIGEREYSSNHFPWRLLAEKGYEVRQVPFRHGGLEPDDVERCVDRGTQLVAFSGVQTASGHRSDIAAISHVARRVGAIVFVDGSQMVGAMPVADDIDAIDVLATSDHKFLMNAGRGIGYCYLSPQMQDRFTPINAGWKAGRVPFDSFFGPSMELSSTASRFDSSISWLAAVGDEAALSVYDTFGADVIFRRNQELAELLRSAMAEIGRQPIDLPVGNRSTIVSVPLGDTDPTLLLGQLKQRGVVCASRDGNLRLAIHFYNHEDDIEQVTRSLTEL